MAISSPSPETCRIQADLHFAMLYNNFTLLRNINLDRFWWPTEMFYLIPILIVLRNALIWRDFEHFFQNGYFFKILWGFHEAHNHLCKMQVKKKKKKIPFKMKNNQIEYGRSGVWYVVKIFHGHQISSKNVFLRSVMSYMSFYLV